MLKTVLWIGASSHESIGDRMKLVVLVSESDKRSGTE
jgi:hypothetical protein